MNKAQKAAWFTLFVLATALGLSLAAFCIGCFVLGAPAKRAAAGFGFMGITGLLGLIPVLFREDRAKVQCDERDVLIYKNGAVAAHIVLWLYLAIVCLVAWWLVGPEGMVSMNVMPLVLIGAVTLFLLVEYPAAFIQYGQGGDNHE